MKIKQVKYPYTTFKELSIEERIYWIEHEIMVGKERIELGIDKASKWFDLRIEYLQKELVKLK